MHLQFAPILSCERPQTLPDIHGCYIKCTKNQINFLNIKDYYLSQFILVWMDVFEVFRTSLRQPL